MSKGKDEALATRQVYQTRKYDQFKTIVGNRDVDKRHVNQLIQLMMANGNLTDQFPIVVGKDGYIIDGQHRLEALKILGWEVGYIVEEKATIETIRNINQGNRNWNWRDIAESYARLPGGEEYAWFLSYFDNHKMTYTAAMLFCTARMTRSRGTHDFASGKLKIQDKAQAVRFADQYEELRERVDIHTHDFAKALNRLFRSPFYDHDRMVEKMRSYGSRLPEKASQADYMREIEAIFNYGFSEESKIRLF